MEFPKNFTQYQQMFPSMFDAFAQGAELARTSGPLDAKTTQLIQLAGAIAGRSQGAVHSHTRRALAAGASNEELFQVVNLMVSTAGFPTAAAAFSWIREIVSSQDQPNAPVRE